MSWSAVGSALMRAISFAALLARSAWAAEAVGCWESMPAPITARSGFFDTMASPLVRIAGVMVVFALPAERDDDRRHDHGAGDRDTERDDHVAHLRTQRRAVAQGNEGGAISIRGPGRRVPADVRHRAGPPVHAAPA